MTTRNSGTTEAMFERNSAVSEADSDFMQYKEEFEKREGDYRSQIQTLK